MTRKIFCDACRRGVEFTWENYGDRFKKEWETEEDGTRKLIKRTIINWKARCNFCGISPIDTRTGVLKNKVLKVEKPILSSVDPEIEKIVRSTEQCEAAKSFLHLFAYQQLAKKNQELDKKLSFIEEKNEKLEQELSKHKQELENKNNEISTLKEKQSSSEQNLKNLAEKTEKDFTNLAIEGAKGLDKNDYSKEEWEEKIKPATNRGELTTNLIQIKKNQVPPFSIYELKNPGSWACFLIISALGGISGYIYFKPEKEEVEQLSPLADIKKKFQQWRNNIIAAVLIYVVLFVLAKQAIDRWLKPNVSWLLEDHETGIF